MKILSSQFDRRWVIIKSRSLSRYSRPRILRPSWGCSSPPPKCAPCLTFPFFIRNGSLFEEGALPEHGSGGHRGIYGSGTTEHRTIHHNQPSTITKKHFSNSQTIFKPPNNTAENGQEINQAADETSVPTWNRKTQNAGTRRCQVSHRPNSEWTSRSISSLRPAPLPPRPLTVGKFSSLSHYHNMKILLTLLLIVILRAYPRVAKDGLTLSLL